MIAILDYGMGNLRSVETAFERFADKVVITADPSLISDADKIILPGVGAFRDAIAALRERKLDEVLIGEVAKGKPLLGICLGFQLLFEESFENGHFKGLGILPGSIEPFEKYLTDHDLKIPHMGWNKLNFPKESPLFTDVEEGSHVYFVHSYFLQTSHTDMVAATTHFGITFASAVSHNNVFGTQFHPEKSQSVGLKMVENFATRC